MSSVHSDADIQSHQNQQLARSRYAFGISGVFGRSDLMQLTTRQGQGCNKLQATFERLPSLKGKTKSNRRCDGHLPGQEVDKPDTAGHPSPVTCQQRDRASSAKRNKSNSIFYLALKHLTRDVCHQRSAKLFPVSGFHDFLPWLPPTSEPPRRRLPTCPTGRIPLVNSRQCRAYQLKPAQTLSKSASPANINSAA